MLGDTFNTVSIWSALTGECERTMKGPPAKVNWATFSPDDQKIVAASGDPYGSDHTVRIWSIVTGGCEACERTTKGHMSHVNSATFSPEGRKIVSARTDGTV